MQKSNLIKHAAVMTAVNLLMRSAGVWFNAYLNSEIGAAGIGLFQLTMTVYSMAATFSCAGIRLAVTRAAVEAAEKNKYDINKTLSQCVTYAGFCGLLIGSLLLLFSNKIGLLWIKSEEAVFPLRVLSLSLPFCAMSCALCGYFTAAQKMPQYSVIQTAEQAVKIAVSVCLLNRFQSKNIFYSCMATVIGMTCSEIISFALSALLKKAVLPPKTEKPAIEPSRFLRVALPDATGTCARSVLLTAEHLLIPRGFEKSGAGGEAANAAYGNIHGLVMPILLYPSAIVSSYAALIVPDLARKNENGDYFGIRKSVVKNLKVTFLFSAVCSVIFFVFASSLSNRFCKNGECAFYIKILSPLVPVMYTDMMTDGMLKGLDQQVYSMSFNIFDSALCVVLVLLVLPKYAVKGYILIMYISEIINFYLSLSRLVSVCEIKSAKIRFFREHKEDNATIFRPKKCSAFRSVCECQTYRGRKKRSQALLFFR